MLELMEFQRIVIDPDICEGKATIRDTRMTVEFVLKLLGAGYTAQDVIREYPGLELADIYECATFGAWLASDNTHDECVEELENLDCRPAASTPNKRETVPGRRSAVGRVLAMRQETERLAEVLLVQPPHAAIGVGAPVVAFDQQVGPSGNRARLHRRYRESKAGGKTHRERFVLHDRGEPIDVRLEDVGGGLTRLRNRYLISDQHDRHLRLRPGKGQSQPVRRARQEGAAWKRLQEGDQTLIGQRLGLVL